MIIGIYNNSGNWSKPSTKSISFIAKFKRASWNIVERKKKIDMKKIFKKFYPKSDFLELSKFSTDYENLEKDLRKFKKVILISNDPIAHGQIKILRFLLKLKNKEIILLNSYGRKIKLNKLILGELSLKQILERYMILEFFLIIPLFILSLIFSFLDFLYFLKRNEKY